MSVSYGQDLYTRQKPIDLLNTARVQRGLVDVPGNHIEMTLDE